MTKLSRMDRLSVVLDRHEWAVFKRIAGRIDDKPGDLASAVYRTRSGRLIDASGSLRRVGYRTVQDAPDKPAYWWPSAARCGELARTTTGEHRERLLEGMLL